MGATANDDVDGDITNNIVTVNPVDTSKPGTYTVTYNVSDTSGNAATEVSRTVTVVASEWYDVEEEGDTTTYTTKGETSSSVSIPSGDFDVHANANGIVIKSKTPQNIDGCTVRTYIIMQDNGEINAGYTHEGASCQWGDPDRYTIN